MENGYIGLFETRFNGQPEDPEQPGASEQSGAPTQPGAPEQTAEPDIRPGKGPGASAEDNLVLPDFPDAFQMFTLAHRPQNMDGSWSARVGFFYSFEELTAYRSWVRGNLQLQSGVEDTEDILPPDTEEERLTETGPQPESQPQS